MTDGFGRSIDYLRISVTDKCNLRCRYCMPPEGVERIPHEEMLTLEEIFRLVSIMADMGLKKVRLTGGEPLVRKNLRKLAEDMDSLHSLDTIAMTTNGILLEKHAAEWRQAGLSEVNISLDTLNAERYRQITGFDGYHAVRRAMDEVLEQGMRLKINCVPCREFNEQDAAELAGLARTAPLDVRFIELMPVGCGRQFHGIPSDELLRKLEEKYGAAKASEEKRGAGPARYYEFAGFAGKIGFISPLSHKFCSSCNRVRLTAEGRLKLCLHYNYGLELKPLLRQGASKEQLREAIEQALLGKPLEHDFAHAETAINADAKKMVQIGG